MLLFLLQHITPHACNMLINYSYAIYKQEKNINELFPYQFAMSPFTKMRWIQEAGKKTMGDFWSKANTHSQKHN